MAVLFHQVLRQDHARTADLLTASDELSHRSGSWLCSASRAEGHPQLLAHRSLGHGRNGAVAGKRTGHDHQSTGISQHGDAVYQPTRHCVEMIHPEVMVRSLLTELRAEMGEAGRRLFEQEHWSPFSCPVVAIDARVNPRKVIITTAIGITGAFATSNVVDNPLMQKFMRRQASIGLKQALKEFFSCSDAQAFTQLWLAYSNEINERGNPVWSHADAARFAMRSKKAFFEREVACVAVTDGNENEDHGVLVFAVDAQWIA